MKNHLKRSKLFIPVLILATLLSVSGCSSAAPSSGTSQAGGSAPASSAPASAQESEKDYGGLTIHIATQPSQTQPALAEELGYFKEEFGKNNINFDVRTFASGPPIIEAFAAGDIDIGQVGAQPAVQAAANDIPLKIIAAYMTGNGKGDGLLARKGSGINALADIRGKKVGVQIGSNSHMLLLRILESVNLTEKDIQLVNLSFTDINTALEAGNIDAGVSQLPQLQTVIDNGTATLLEVDGSKFPRTSSVIIVSEEFTKKYPELIPRILKTLDKTVTYCKEHEDEAIKILSKRNGVAENSYKASFASTDFSLYLDKERLGTLQDTKEFLQEQGTIKDVDLNQIIDTSYLEEAGISKN